MGKSIAEQYGVFARSCAKAATRSRHHSAMRVMEAALFTSLLRGLVAGAVLLVADCAGTEVASVANAAPDATLRPAAHSGRGGRG